MNKSEWLITAGAAVLLFVIFGVPAILVPAAMDNVPARSQARVLTWYQTAVDVAEQRFRDHLSHSERRHAPLPADSREWVELINPMGRKAPGGGFAVLPDPDRRTGAIGISGNNESVTIILPAYGDLERFEYTISLDTVRNESDGQAP
jgi:hypothetical protein